jgi:hypothetical protein
VTVTQLIKSLKLAEGEGYGECPVIVQGDNKEEWHEADAVGMGDSLTYSDPRSKMQAGKAVRVHP